jgi:hypothetical protein
MHTKKLPELQTSLAAWRLPEAARMLKKSPEEKYPMKRGVA